MNISLEVEFAQHAFRDVDVHEKCGFIIDCLSPNEGHPEGIIPHLELSNRGIIVSTGTERSYYDLLFCNVNKCEGLVVRDINPRVKAYVDFNTMLMRLSTSLKEYQELSSRTDSLKDRIKVITAKLEKGSLPDHVRRYYMKHINDFGEIYLNKEKIWETEHAQFFEKCKYHENEELFWKLKKYADEGNIISTIGDINDLRFLKSRSVSVVDTSNISDYVMLDIKGEGDFRPRVILTNQKIAGTDYKSYAHPQIDENDRAELNQLMDKVSKAVGHKIDSMWMHNNVKVKGMSKFNNVVGSVYSTNTLCALRKYVDENILDVPGLGPVSMEDGIRKLNSATASQLDDLCKNERIKFFVTALVSSWVVLEPSVYLAFSKIEGWKEEFEVQHAKPYNNLEGFLDKLSGQNLLDGFIQDFGKDRLQSFQFHHLSSSGLGFFSEAK